MRPLTPDLTDDERGLLRDVAEHGCHVVCVDADLPGGSYCYTVGLWYHWQHPELVVFGVSDELADELLNAATDMIDAGARFAADQVVRDLLEIYPVTFKAVPRTHNEGYFGAACWAHATGDFPVLQLVYPDRQGRYPWQPGAARAFQALQPLLADLPPTPPDANLSADATDG